MRLKAPAAVAALAVLVLLSACAGGAGRAKREQQVTVHYQMGMAALQDNNPQGAIVEFNQALSEDPKDTRVRYAMGHALFTIQDYPGALEQFQQILKLEPDNGDAINYIGNIYEKMGREAEAIAAFEKAMALPTYRSVHLPMHNLARIYLARGDWQRAEELLLGALRRMPEYLPGIADLAHLYMERSMWEKAAAQWDVVTKLAPKLPDGYYYLARTLDSEGKAAAALLALGEYFRVAESEHPLYPDAVALRDELQSNVR